MFRRSEMKSAEAIADDAHELQGYSRASIASAVVMALAFHCVALGAYFFLGSGKASAPAETPAAPATAAATAAPDKTDKKDAPTADAAKPTGEKPATEPKTTEPQSLTPKGDVGDAPKTPAKGNTTGDELDEMMKK